MSERGRSIGLRCLAVAILGLLGVPAPATAGGWATVELDEPLARVSVGEPITIGFMVLQHGVTPFEGAKPHLAATHRESGEEISADGRADGEPGHYVVEVVFPMAGEWKWGITPEPFAEILLPPVTALTAEQLAAGPGLPVVPEAEAAHPADVVRGDCGSDATPAYALAEVVPFGGETSDADKADAPVVKESETVLPIALSELATEAHAIAVRSGSEEGATVACGEILGEPRDGELIVGLAEEDGSGYVGFARLAEEGGETSVTVYLAHGLAGPAGVPVTIDDAGFSPARLEIPAGTTVTWTNAGTIVHTVASEDLDFDDSGILQPGATYSQRFDEPGIYEYRCGPHAYMIGTIVVS